MIKELSIEKIGDTIIFDTPYKQTLRYNLLIEKEEDFIVLLNMLYLKEAKKYPYLNFITNEFDIAYAVDSFKTFLKKHKILKYVQIITDGNKIYIRV